MRKLLPFLLALMLLLCPALAEEEEEEWSLEDSLAGLDQGLLGDIFINVEEAINVETGEKPVSIYEEDGSILITLTATGDFTVGGDSRKSSNIWDTELKKHDGDYHFAMKNIRDVLLADDLTIVNFEGTLTESTYIPSSKKNNDFLFSAPPEYVTMLSENGVEAVALENNHTLDHGEEAYAETQSHLSNAGIVWSGGGELGVIEVKGIQIAMLSYLCIDRYDQLWDTVPADIAAAKAQYPIVIVNFHWGNELMYYPTDNQIKMGRLAVDSGADLVLGHHSHRIQPIEYYNGVYICYSLGNFCFAGNSKPSDMTSYLFQTRFRVRGEGEAQEITNEGFIIIPIRISSRADKNDFIPTVLTKESTIDSIMNTLKENGRKHCEYAVEEYPLAWEE
ncbi:MAG: CapA family protein [Clostridia bacterium]|nr:CapA family protein [Clostridia bacterium]